MEQTVHPVVYPRSVLLKHQSWGCSTPRVPLCPARDLDLTRVPEGLIAHLFAPVPYELFQSAPDFVHVTFIYSVVR